MRLPNIEKEITDEILKANGLSTYKLGLRFDHVVSRVLGDLRRFAGGAMPGGLTVLIAISAPIRSPAKTAKALEQEIETLLLAGSLRGERSATINGNQVQIRFAKHTSNRHPKLIGFVQDPNGDPKPLLDLAEQWLRAEAS
jgi:hypothetical protein